jgi:hypothetical protein
MIKTKGNAFYQNGTGPIEVWDAIDVVKPPVEDGAAFLSTNFLRTRGQTRGTCDGIDTCKSNNDCVGLSHNADASGIRTGLCTPDGFCQVQGWCPVEENIPGRATFNYLQGVDAFTLFLRVSVSFQTKNPIRTDSGSSLVMGKTLFSASDLLEKAGITYEQVRQLGSLVAISYDWDCDLDVAISKCKPAFAVARLDDPTSKFSTGFNYRYADYYTSINYTAFNSSEVHQRPIEYRDLYKVYGMRFVVLVSGTGRKFDIKNLATNLGSGLAMLGIAATVADVLLMYVLPKRQLYRQVKVKEMQRYIDETDVEAVVNEDDPLIPKMKANKA